MSAVTKLPLDLQTLNKNFSSVAKKSYLSTMIKVSLVWPWSLTSWPP